VVTGNVMLLSPAYIIVAMPICRRFLLQLMARLRMIIPLPTGAMIATITVMIATTTSSSTKVKPLRDER
jgi:hypothetical protein